MSQPSRTKRDVVTEFREAEIIDAARRVIAEHGLRKASMEKIADAANISKGTLYLYFDNKEGLVGEATERGHAEMAAYVEQAMAAAGSPVEAIRAYVRAALQFCDDNDVLFRAMNTYPESSNDRAGRAVAQRIGDYIDILESHISAGIRDKSLRPVPARRIARLLVEAVRTLVIERLRDPGQATSVQDDAQMLLDLVLDGIRA
jgi:TetR/AcrR family transcriptional regulator